MKIKWKLSVMSILILCICSIPISCTKNNYQTRNTTEYNHLFNMEYIPSDSIPCQGWYTDHGAWMGFTLPHSEKMNDISATENSSKEVKLSDANGFIGPYSLLYRYWWASSVVDLLNKTVVDSTNYSPGLTTIYAHQGDVSIKQRMYFVNQSTVLIEMNANEKREWKITGNQWAKSVKLKQMNNEILVSNNTEEQLILSFIPGTTITMTNNNYLATSQSQSNTLYMTISMLNSKDEQKIVRKELFDILSNPNKYINKHDIRWNKYIQKALRKNRPKAYNRIAVKSMVTLISNWRTMRGGLHHDGIIPSHAVGYFVGFWAWDSWRFSAGLAAIAPKLAKDNIRAMFDYQQENGMIIDCIYVNADENNSRDSKPPLCSWAVNAIYEANKDTAFVKEMYPQLLKYYRWWYRDRDHNQNKMCEYGSTDGTRVAAAWESGMDNAIRFDDAKIIKNGKNAYSYDQESVDLNAYLALENRLLRKFSHLIGESFNEPDRSKEIADYFFNTKKHFFFDKRISDNPKYNEKSIIVEGCEAYTPLWANIATKEQVSKMLPILQDTTKFSTYIPFPTVSADNPKFQKNGYWRGPIWLDQCYFAIHGLRNYGFENLANKYTCQVFERLEGISQQTPIYENYDTHTGKILEAPHFSWSAAHLLMLYWELTTNKPKYKI